MLDSNDALLLRLQRAGISAAAIESVLAVDAMLQNWRRQAARRELGRRALTDLKLDLDLAQFDVLVAIEAPANEFGTNLGETMVATVAERLGIDPSRASRVISEMVDAGYARRAVSQADARRTIIELTEHGKAVVNAVREYKFLIMGDFFNSWDPAVLRDFLPLLVQFSAWIDHTEEGAGRFQGEIAQLAEALAKSAKARETA